jgi:hypothetical protein
MADTHPPLADAVWMPDSTLGFVGPVTVAASTCCWTLFVYAQGGRGETRGS